MRKKHSLGIRNKLILIFIFIKVLPLLALAWFAWNQIAALVDKMQDSFETATIESQQMGGKVVDLATRNSIRALDLKSREAIERLTVDTACSVARFLYERDGDILQAALLAPSEQYYSAFLSRKKSPVIYHAEYEMDVAGEKWQPAESAGDKREQIENRNPDNTRDFHARPAEMIDLSQLQPMYLEMTFVDLQGRERVKVTTSDEVAAGLRDVSKRENTYCRAENYFSHLQKLGPGEIYVSDVIGAYRKTHMIGTYSKVWAEAAGRPFDPGNSAYAGAENPLGKRFSGLVRWATPVTEGGEVIGYVTLALDHTHLMEFTDHIVPTEERYSEISDAGSGNYAFMWDYLSRNISHPRDYFITGYDPQTGEPVIPWLTGEYFNKWQESGESVTDFLAGLPLYEAQSLTKTASGRQIDNGTVGLDCRYLNFAPQCDGWVNLTRNGGSGSFLIFWSGLWKLTTAAAIPYYTGQYADRKVGFGFVTIGANVDEFHKAAEETAETIKNIGKAHTEKLKHQVAENRRDLTDTFRATTRNLTLSTTLMIVAVVIIAVWMASVLTRRIVKIIGAFNRFQKGSLGQRLEISSGDELEDLAGSFNSMADTLQSSIREIQVAHEGSKKANRQLLQEVEIRQRAEKELARHRDSLEAMVQARTLELEQEIEERKQAEKSKREMEERLHQAEKMEAIGTLAGGVAHDLNNILSGIATYPELLLLQINKQDPMYKSLQTIRSSGEKAAAIVQDLLTLARRGVSNPVIFNINSIVTDYLASPEHSELQQRYPEVKLVTNLARNLLNVKGSEVHLAKTLMNLVSNGFEAMADGGTLTIQTQNRYLDSPLKLYDNTLTGEYVSLIVSDTGSGIREEDQARIFEPFYTNKKMGRSGTGLGMAVVWGTVQDHGGYIDCRSRPGEGTVFTLYFPVCREDIDVESLNPQFSELGGGGESILVVDDVAEQREIASMILKKLGYRLYTVKSGEEALQFLEKTRVALVILDMIMESGIDGLETYEAIREKWPEQRVIVASGFAETDRLNRALDLGVRSHLKKPYSITNLGQQVKMAMEC